MKKILYINTVGLLLLAIFSKYEILSKDAVNGFILVFFIINSSFLAKLIKDEKKQK